MDQSQPRNRFAYRREMKRIIRCIILNDNDLSTRINSFNNQCLRECIEKKYITGFPGGLNLNNEWMGSINNPKVTEAGYNYLVDDAILRNKLTLIISIVAILISIVSFVLSLVL